jgi:hypothetical protein
MLSCSKRGSTAIRHGVELKGTEPLGVRRAAAGPEEAEPQGVELGVYPLAETVSWIPEKNANAV